ncbi:MAG: lipoyl(octanoyl) transferase LipB [Candidatus Omnitrophica bacterium]|nr:lipoyl(octanoyl) transferase LipB [Candidatus Omnitrophota bacterium]
MKIYDLGMTEYEDVLKLQSELLVKRIKGEIQDLLIVTEHKPVITHGRIAEESSIIDKSFLKKNGISVVSTGRGGKITYHAPGQLVIYPIIDLKLKKRDISFYIDVLEKVAVSVLNRIEVPAERFFEKRGIWVENRKIGFIGIAVKKWVTYHGMAVNVNNDITPFGCIDPCGEKNIKVMSVKDYLGHEVEISKVKDIFVEEFAKVMKEEYCSGVTV